MTFQQFLNFTPVFRVVLLQEPGGAKSPRGAVFKRGFHFIRGGFIGNTERPHLNLIRPTRVPDAQRGGTVEPGKRWENVVVTGQTQGANFTQTLLGFRVGVAVVAGDLTIDPDVGIGILSKEKSAAVPILTEL